MKSLRLFVLIFTLMCDVLAACSQPSHKVIRVLDSKSVRTEEHSWILTSVELREDCLILEKYVGPLESENTWVMSTPAQFVEDAITGERFYIKESEIGFESHKVFLKGYEGLSFKETYPPLPADVRYLNISSGSDFFLKYLDLEQDCSPARPPVSEISFSGVNLGMPSKEVYKFLKKEGYKNFYSEEEEGLLGGYDVYTYFQGSEDDYAVTVEIEASKECNIVYGIEVLYQNHVDMYEVEEHLQEIVDEIKSIYPYRKWEEATPSYRNAASMITQKSGKDGIFKNITIRKFSGHYRLYDSPDAKEDEFYGTISLEVHDDNLHHDLVISVRYNDRDVSTYVRRRAGKVKW